MVIGFEETPQFKKKVAFASDTAIAETRMQLNTAEQEKEDQFKSIRTAMRALIDSEKKAFSVGLMTETES